MSPDLVESSTASESLRRVAQDCPYICSNIDAYLRTFRLDNGIRFMFALPEPSPSSGTMELGGGYLGPPRETRCRSGKIGRPPYTMATPQWMAASSRSYGGAFAIPI